MKISLILQTEAWQIALLVFGFMLLATWLGKKMGDRYRKKGKPDGKVSETSGLTGLLFFLLAFTFGMSGSRYENRRATVVEEANDIGTALLRSDLYPDTIRTLLRNDFKEYIEARVAFYEAGADVTKILKADSLSQTISAEIWRRTCQLSRDPANQVATRQMIPALNDMIDITTTRMAGEKAKVPESILIMLFCLACINSFYSGYANGRKGAIDWFVEIGFCLLVSLVILFTIDLDRPRRGFVNLDGPNQTIVDLQKAFK